MPLMMTDIAEGAKAASDTFEYPEQNYERTQQAKQLTQENQMKLQKMYQDANDEQKLRQGVMDAMTAGTITKEMPMSEQMQKMANIALGTGNYKLADQFATHAANAKDRDLRSKLIDVQAAEHTMGLARNAVDMMTTPEDWDVAKTGIRKNGLLDEPEIKKIDEQIQGIMNRVKTTMVDENGKERDMTPEERKLVYSDALKPVRDTWHQKLTTVNTAIAEHKLALEEARIQQNHEDKRVQLAHTAAVQDNTAAIARERLAIDRDRQVETARNNDLRNDSRVNDDLRDLERQKLADTKLEKLMKTTTTRTTKSLERN
jgi:hypothetical protein